MGSPKPKPKLLVIVGPTASGKSELAMKIAKKFNGEIVSADSRMVYKGMDVGTGKPTKAERAMVPHHLLNIVEPDQFFSAAEYKKLAEKTIKTIKVRGKLPILVGGSGLYIDSVLFDFDFLPPPDLNQRQRLSKMGVEELQAEIKSLKLTLPLNLLNKRHLIRTIETGGWVASKKPLRKDALIVGLNVENDELRTKISKRNQEMVEGGLESEVRQLEQKYGRNAKSFDALGYREWQDYFDGKINEEQAISLITKNSMAYARRQKTWFKRNRYINWFNDSKAAYEFIEKSL